MSSIVYKKLMDIENQKENPFQTKYGQEIVSIQESFQSRLWREGRPRHAMESGSTLPLGSDLTTTVITSAGCELYPLFISFSADVDCIIQIQHTTYLQDMGRDNNGVVYEPIFLKAGTPFVRNYYGELRYSENGFCRVYMRGATTAGKVWMSFYGIEVDTIA